MIANNRLQLCDITKVNNIYPQIFYSGNYFSQTDTQFQSDSKDFLTKSQRFDEFQKTGNRVYQGHAGTTGGILRPLRAYRDHWEGMFQYRLLNLPTISILMTNLLMISN